MPLGRGLTFNAAAALSFRSPTLNETLVSGMHPEPADFPIRPNPGLRPERARSLELGLAYDRDIAGGALHLGATVFRTEVADYIELDRKGTLFNAFYQYDNLAHVRIDGLEVEARFDTGAAYASLAGQILDGQNRDSGAALERVPPDRLVLTTGLRSADTRREGGARITLTGSKQGGTLRSDAWRTVDLFFRQDVGANATFGLALNNILDESFTPHLDIQPAAGFNAQASLTFRF